MTSHDVRDMLDLPDAASRPAKKQKIAAPRSTLKGLAREVQALGGDNPIAIVPEVSKFKKKRFASRKPAAKWQLKPFTNSARNGDFLTLRHWRRKTEARPAPVGEDGEPVEQPQIEEQMEDSTFAKFNVRVHVPEYTEGEYISRLQNPDWTKDETDYLVGLAYEYDLRWPIIWDRYEYAFPLPTPGSEAAEGAIIKTPTARTMEDLKARYYSVAATMMAERKPPIKMNSAEFNLHEIMSNFNPAIETARKKFAEAAFRRTKEEAREEESLVLELKRILARSERLNDERKDLYARLESPMTAPNIRIADYTTSVGLHALLQQLMQASKKKRISMPGEGFSPAVGSSGLNGQNSFDRRESNARDSLPGPSSTKKGPSQGGPSERRQLSEEEERIYGVTHHERFGTSGPAFRHEKISKPLVSKSAAQQAKIANVLTELEIPSRLIMPTHEVGEAYDGLLQSINSLLELRKLTDKLDGEIKFVQGQIRERQKAARLARGELVEEDGPAEGQDADGDGIKTEEGEKSVGGSMRAGSVPRSVRGGSVLHKRSASVLSAASDKSTKKQRR